MKIKDNLLIADKGKVLTDDMGYWSTFSLGNGRTADEFHEITIEEYEKILAEQESEAP